MKVIKRKGTDARLVLNRMVTDSTVLGPIAAKWTGKMFGSRADNLIAGWAVRYYQKYAKAPGKAIALDYDRWAESQRDTEIADAIGTFLESLSAETKRLATIGTDVVLDTAALVFDKVQIERQHEEAKAALERGDIAKAREISNSFRPVTVGTTSGLSVFKGGAVVRNAFRNIDQSLVQWDQPAMKRFFAGMLARDEFIVFVAPEKRGKSFWLQEVCFQAVLCKLKVAMFEVGDQSQRQILRRFAARAAGRPAKSDTRVLYPISIEPGELAPEVAYDERSYDNAMTPKESDRALKDWGKMYGPDQFRLSVHPNSTINMAGIGAILEDWARDDWRADVVVVDYMDILAPMQGNTDSRDQINANWKAARSLNQKLHCLFVTATQGDADSYDAEEITMSNFSDDKRKNAHCTGAIGINQNDTEKKKGLYRLKWTLARDLDFSSPVWCAGCLSVANPCVLSVF